MKELLTGLCFVGLCLLAAFGTPENIDHSKSGYWFSVVPPLLAVCLAIMTGKLIPSLVSAVVIGGVLITVPANLGSLKAWGSGLATGVGYVWSSATDSFNFQILLFVIFIMMMIGVLVLSGGLHGVVKWISQWARDAKSSRLATVIMGLIVFIDDYANTIIVGSAMRPIADKHRISREKLAFLVDATAAPIAGLALVSTWIGYVISLFADSSKTVGLGAGGYEIFIDTLPFRFYCILMLVFVFVNVLRGVDFGPMKKAEERSKKTGAVLAPDAKPLSTAEVKGPKAYKDANVFARVAVIPMATLMVFLFAGLWVDGGGVAKLQESVLSVFNPAVWRDVLIASENSVTVLALGSALALALSIILALSVSKIPLNRMKDGLWAGFKNSLIPCIILTLAWSLKASCDGLMTGPFLVATVGDVFSPFVYPTVIFLIAALTAFSTGTSWGTMAILIPTALPIAYQLDGGAYGLTVLVCLAAVLDGAIMGDHCSPISDTTIMSSIGTGCDHLHHVRTQMPYALLVGTICVLLGFIPAAMGTPPVVCLLMGVAAIFIVFAYLSQAGKRARRA